MAKRKKS